MAFTKNSLVFFLCICLLVLYSQTVKSQNCGCAPNLCCSQYGYCGTSDAYCGAGCQSGPCRATGTPSGGGGSVSSIVTQNFFNSIISQADNGCVGKRFYTRDSFINAANTFPRIWMNSVRPVLNQGFGATIRAINGMECNNRNSGAVNSRVSYYRDYCRKLGVSTGRNLRC